MALCAHFNVGCKAVKSVFSGAHRGAKLDEIQVQSAALVISEPDYRNLRLPLIGLVDLCLVTSV